MNRDTLKARYRAVRDGYPPDLNLRIHRALSWLKRTEMAEDDDGRFIFLWIAFNAAYACTAVPRGIAASTAAKCATAPGFFSTYRDRSVELLRRIPRQGFTTSRHLHEQVKAAGFDVSLRTVQRHLDAIYSHFPIECDTRSKPPLPNGVKVGTFAAMQKRGVGDELPSNRVDRKPHF